MKISSSGAFPDHPERGAFDGLTTYRGTMEKPFVTTLNNSWIQATFPKPVQVGSVVLYQGRYEEWSRAKKVVLELSDGTKIPAEAEGRAEEAQTVAVNKPTQSVKVTVTDVYAGPKPWGGWAEIEINGPRREVKAVKDAVTIESAIALMLVRNKKLTLEVTLASNDGKPHAVALSAVVTDPDDGGFRKPLSLAEPVAVPADGTAVGRMELDWPDPTLWWPDKPKLYAFEVVAAEGGQPVAKARLAVWLPRAVDRRGGLHAQRLPRVHAGGHRGRVLLDHARPVGRGRHDRHHRRHEGQELQPPAHVRHRQVRFRRRRQGRADVHRRDRPVRLAGRRALRRPDVLEDLARHRGPAPACWPTIPASSFWGGGNEMTLHDSSEATCDKLLDLQKTIQAVDPSRPVQFSGDGDLRGRAVIMNLHYPHDPGRFVTYPNVLYALRGGDAGGAYAGATWNQDKPLLLGEVGWVNHGMPEKQATFGGDLVYVNEAYQYAAAERMWVMQAESYRLMGIPCNIFVGHGEGKDNYDAILQHGRLAKANADVAAHLVELDTEFYARAKVDRSMVVYNYTRFPLEAHLIHDAGPAGKGNFGVSLPPGARTKYKITLAMPDVDKPVDITWPWRIESAEGKVLFEDQRGAARGAQAQGGVEAPRPAVRSGRRGQVVPRILRRGHRARGFAGQAAPPAPGRHGAAPGNASSHGAAEGEAGAVLVIGINAIQTDGQAATLAAPLEAFVAAGGRVVCMDQPKAPADLLPVSFPLRQPQPITMAWLRAKGHPILAGLRDETVQFWRLDNIVCISPFAKPVRGNFRPIIDAGAGVAGLEYVPLLEVPHGRGTYIACQMPVYLKGHFVPGAGELLINMLQYAEDFQPAGRLATVLAAADSPYGKMFESLGLRSAELDAAKLLLVDASAASRPAWQDHLAQLADAAKAGAVVMLFGLEPATAKDFAGLLGPDVKLTPYAPKPIPNDIWAASAEGMQVISDDPAVRGISNGDLSWKAGGGDFIAGPPLAKDAAKFSAAGADLTELVRPGIMLSRKLGAGAVVLVQLSAGDARNIDMARRVYSILLTNAGAELAAKSLAPVRMEDYFQLDLSGIFNRPLEDQTADDTKGGWTDQGPNDLRQLPQGLQVLAGVPFVVEPIKTFANARCLVLAGKHTGWGPVQSEPVKLGRPAVSLSFLHAAAWAAQPGLDLGKYVVTYQDGSTVEIPVQAGRDVRDWWDEPKDAANAAVAWTGANAVHAPIAVYAMTWKNPKPAQPIASVRAVSSQTEGTLILLAVTGRNPAAAP